MSTGHKEFDKVLSQHQFSHEDLVLLLSSEGQNRGSLLAKAARVKEEEVGNKVYYRGLIEYSNICSKNCLYCGVRSGNTSLTRFRLSDEEVLSCSVFARESKFGSIVIQAGEKSTKEFVGKIEELLKRIHQKTDHELHVTLSLGEQTEETYRRWQDAGAHRYLLRIEVSDPELYRKLHPHNRTHDYFKRLDALYTLKRLGYQVGTGVMVGLPFQTVEHLAKDLVFFQGLDIDMAGLGPYIEHPDTPLYRYRDSLLPREQRFDLSLKMVALLRIMMKDINIAATTAMQSIDAQGREKALMAGANVLMPNLTPLAYRKDYLLYQDKPCKDEAAAENRAALETAILRAGGVVAYGEWGDSAHYGKRGVVD